MMRCALCLLLANVACCLDDDGCLAQATVRVHGSQQPEYPSLVAAQAEAEQHQRVRELKDAKYGEQMTLLVKDVLGREFNFQFRRSTALRVLMGSVCKRLGLEQSQVFFRHNGTQLNGDETLETVGVADHDTIQVDGQVLQEAKAAKDLAEQRAAAAAKMKAEREAEEAAIMATKEQKRMRVAKRAAKVQTEQKREHMLKTRGEGTLRFTNEEGKEIQMSYKRQNWLSGLMSLVCNRFSMDPAQARFYHGKKVIEPHDSIQSLGLLDDELITVKTA
eukprot:CAMPEP_0179061876 /NCGR_PEP_ID=MMETSP0796-20121207/26638_1 /TAXON_ID=73915 /ORGANISM="Pyrodinium bahamense, Strain pbaha01" /LENGTH=275 /DNA_ID=CAMNT_0020758765 /DNA_START=68 /DNA_END=895 /DNA_ORIENTATION=-